jgi:hypothetical protein
VRQAEFRLRTLLVFEVPFVLEVEGGGLDDEASDVNWLVGEVEVKSTVSIENFNVDGRKLGL